MSEDRITLPLDVRKQRAVLGHVILDNIFFQQLAVRVEPDWFVEGTLSKVYKAVQAWWATYKRLPTVDELKSYKDIAQYAADDRAALHNTINASIAETSNYKVDSLRNELAYWLTARIYRAGVQESERAYNLGKFDECYNIIGKRMKELNEAKFVQDIAKSFADPSTFLKHVEHRYDDAISFGIKAMDDAMMPPGMDSGPPGASKGLLLGDTTVMLAPANVGKTSFLITVARHNIMRHKSVLWFTHEGVDDDLQTKMMQSVLGVDTPTLLAMYKTEEGLEEITMAMRLVERYLVYIPFNEPGMTVEELVPIIERRQEERRAKYDGKGFDLLVDDYPGLLTSKSASGGRLEQRNLDSLVYNYFVQLGLKHRFHVLCAIQTNRDGSKANRDDSRLLTMEDVRESWDVMCKATNVITINRDKVAESRNRVTYYISKSRSGRTGRAVVCRTNYGATLTHSEQLGATYYYGSQSLADHIDNYLERFKGKEISQDALAEAM
jgi:replicative DNA helicase